MTAAEQAAQHAEGLREIAEGIVNVGTQEGKELLAAADFMEEAQALLSGTHKALETIQGLVGDCHDTRSVLDAVWAIVNAELAALAVAGEPGEGM